MAGRGKNAAWGMGTEVTAGTGVTPAVYTPITEANIEAPREIIESAALAASRTILQSTNASQAPALSFTNENDGSAFMQGFYYWNGGDDGHAVSAFTGAKITTAPTGSAASGGTLADGDYKYKVASIINWTALDHDYVMPASAESLAITIATSNNTVDLAWTDPTTLTLPTGFTYVGTAIYRTIADGSVHAFVYYKSGTGNTWSDDGSETRDAAVVPYTTNLYEHICDLPSSDASLPAFSATFYQDIAQSKRIAGARMDTFELSIAGQNEISRFTYAGLGRLVAAVANPSPSVTINEPIAGSRIDVAINDVSECTIESITVSGSNGMEHVNGICDQDYPLDVEENDFRRVTVTLVRQLLDLDMWNRVQNGTVFSITIRFHGQPVVASGSTLNVTDHGIDATPVPYIVELDLYECRAGNADAPVSGPGRIQETITATVNKSATEGTDLQLRVINTTSNYT